MSPEPYNLEAECAAAQKRIAQYVSRSAAQHLRQMRESWARVKLEKTEGAQ